jgi:protein-S-isoprenylcysteine O-methyltransferase Ste14
MARDAQNRNSAANETGFPAWLELKVPPAALVLLFAAAMWIATRSRPGYAFGTFRIVALLLFGLGISFCVAGVAAFRKAQTTVDPTTPAAAVRIVTRGVYRISRNPMYVGFLLLLFGWAVFLAHPFGFAFPTFFVVYLNRFQIGPEERALGRKFGPAYHAYRRSTPRWLLF